ncbi:lytic transglycosylase domain-containing protein [Labrys monachus]|uniref:Transglycosylase SLT domain-containing protein n=1 Tax=Labrys monachus TaxID=217067 RepID=A0ABU0FH89_9HYPH|nr:lytic transglycosylase domain-containing protein [Labrys monachus]MDQ0393483.1 hypothetical protein [Labrys monachus]
MLFVNWIACEIARTSSIPLFAGKPFHSFVPLDDPSAGARSAGPGRSKIGALRAPLTVASTLAVWRRSGDRTPVRSAVLLLSVMLAVEMPLPCQAQPEPVRRQTSVDPYAADVGEAAQRFELSASWIRAVMRAESGGDPRATSPKGAMGLMQIMPETWAELRIRHRLGSDAYDPHDNIIAGAAYIRALFDRYGSPGWIAAYNAGPGRYEASLKGRPLPLETRAYVAAIAPILDGGDTAESVLVATAGPPSWTRAPLFVVQAGRASSASPVQSDARSGDARAATPVRDVSAITPQSGGLFVARADTGEPR